jgi:hypothetical protein
MKKQNNPKTKQNEVSQLALSNKRMLEKVQKKNKIKIKKKKTEANTSELLKSFCEQGFQIVKEMHSIGEEKQNTATKILLQITLDNLIRAF